MSDERHPSDLVIARLLLGQVPAEEAQAIERHAAGCARCAADLAAAHAAAARFTAVVQPRTLPELERRLAGRPWWSVLPQLGVAAAAAAMAAVVFLVVAPVQEPRWGSTPSADAWGIKGQGTLTVVAMREGRVFKVQDGDRLRAGDAVRFQVQPGGARWALVASIDGRGRATVYQESTPVSPDLAAPQALPDSIVLDDAPGPERIFAVFSEESLDPREVIAALGKLGARGPEAVRRAWSLELPHPQATVLIEKE
jgi:hypothetical protein